MRPVRVTTQGASLSLPLRMAAIGTGASVGISIWVVSDGRYEPQNFPFYHIEDKDLVWDFNKSISNYTTLRSQHETALGGKGWEIESSLGLNETLITNVIMSGGRYFPGGGGFGPSQPSDPSEDYLPVGDPDAGADAGPYESAEQVRNDDIAHLFAGMTGPNVRVTRMRSDIAHAAMTVDFLLQASADQSELSNIRQVTQSVNAPQCPTYTCQQPDAGQFPVWPFPWPMPGSGGDGQGSSQGTSSGGGTSQTNSSNGGCAASSESGSGSGASLGVLLGMVGLVVVRVARGRRRGS
jgi:hypothetical protein